MNNLKFGLAALISPALFGATIIHDYSFLGNLSDSLGGPNLVSQGGTVNSNNYTFPFRTRRPPPSSLRVGPKRLQRAVHKIALS